MNTTILSLWTPPILYMQKDFVEDVGVGEQQS